VAGDGELERKRVSVRARAREIEREKEKYIYIYMRRRGKYKDIEHKNDANTCTIVVMAGTIADIILGDGVGKFLRFCCR
jgi:hypothetical protein